MATTLEPVPVPVRSGIADSHNGNRPPLDWLRFFNWLYEIAKNTTLAEAGVLGPYSAAINITAAPYGPPDTREGTWGNAEAFINTVTFNPPSGYRVRVKRLYGTVYAMPKLATPASLPTGAYAAVLWGIQTTAPDGSVRGDYMADNCLIFLQGAVSAETPLIIQFDNEIVPSNGLLQPDHKLNNKEAAFLNTMGVPIQMEATYNVVYEFVPASSV